MDQTEGDSKTEAPPATPSKPTPSPASRKSANPNTNDTIDNPPHSNTADDDDELSPPPDNIPSPALPGSPLSSPVPPDEQTSDEIVVSSNRHASDKPSPFHVVSDQEDETLPDADDQSPQPTPYPKRKRTSTFADLNEDEMDGLTADYVQSLKRSKPVRRQGSGPNNSSVVLGYWRDSPVADEAGKHAVIGFIDVRDRLRTRIQVVTRDGDPVKEPVPPGPGGLWVTFERIVFEPYLVGLNHYHVKEFVKKRTGAREENPDAKLEADLAAVEEAKRRVSENPPPDAAPAPAVAYGPTLPDDAIISASAKRRKLTSGVSTILGGTSIPPHQPPAKPSRAATATADSRRVLPSARDQSDTSSPAQSVPIFDPLVGTRPTRIVVGYWKPSDAPDPRDRHAVLGILGHNDNFRVKVIRETRDGRYVDGNFPLGAGALWIQWTEMELEPHIKHLTRIELKEYVRVRQYQIDRGETPAEKIKNEGHAVYVAQRRALHIIRTGSVPASSGAHAQPEDEADDADFAEPAGARNEGRASVGGQEPRTSHRRQDLPAARHSLPNLDSGRQSSRTPTAARRDIDLQARREMGRLEQYERSRAQSNAEREAAATKSAADSSHGAAEPTAAARGSGSGSGFANGFHARDEVQQLDDIWQRQEGQRNRANNDNVKFYGGTKYERKSTGPFVGKLVSQGVLISIDGEDYVEYRVLTKPSFC
ncbi:hypothetical protein ACRALDRAFT_2023649 [Sodiomyces alcalophilus JCM 7366]|uniref:uncharacterized protein n=1 Tax=Sodiomyces alcalophilus JCM 7366 TaxID=591952 RepID=UPI0039B48747